MVCAIFSIVACTLFGAANPDQFHNFSASFFTVLHADLSITFQRSRFSFLSLALDEHSILVGLAELPEPIPV